jgi:hypothetical protein
MKFQTTLLTFCLAGLAVNSLSLAHDCFTKPLEERYQLKTVSCKTCHPDNKDRSIHNKLGILFENALKGKELSKKFKEAEAQGDEAKATCEKMMVEEFKKVLVEVEQEKLTLADMIKFGLINGMRLNDDGEEAATKALREEAEAAKSKSSESAESTVSR